MRILCVHQGYELYGSDRVFVASMKAMRRRWPSAELKVVLPSSGPLEQTLRQAEFDVVIQPLVVLRRSRGLAALARDGLRLPGRVLAAWKQLRRYDVLYVNTIVVLDFLIAGSLTRMPRLVHVHETVSGRAKLVFSRLLRLFGGLSVYNSQATRESFGDDADGVIVHNGVDDRKPETFRPSYNDPGEFRVLMIGRINSWKGQDLLLDAVSQASDQLRRQMKLVILGNEFESQKLTQELRRRLRDLPWLDARLVPFVDDPIAFYEWADVVVVPSKRPEPFGLVAVEAMMFERLVVAANHGGLREILGDPPAGDPFEPGSSSALHSVLERACADRAAATIRARHGRTRFLQRFTTQAYDEAILGAMASCLLEAAHCEAGTESR